MGLQNSIRKLINALFVTSVDQRKLLVTACFELVQFVSELASDLLAEVVRYTKLLLDDWREEAGHLLVDLAPDLRRFITHCQ